VIERPLTICPTSPELTRSFIEDRWGDKPVGLTAAFLNRRQQFMNNKRLAGHLRESERYGWLSIAALWLGLGPQEALKIDARTAPDFTASTLTAPQDLGQQNAGIPGTSIKTYDPRDPVGLWAADLAADTSRYAAVEIAGHRMNSAVAATELIDTIRKTS
jgi:hypothetical protein